MKINISWDHIEREIKMKKEVEWEPTRPNLACFLARSE